MKRPERSGGIGLEIEVPVLFEPVIGDLGLFNAIYAEAAQIPILGRITGIK